jgi:hypothetical protein
MSESSGLTARLAEGITTAARSLDRRLRMGYGRASGGFRAKASGQPVMAEDHRFQAATE